MILNQEQIHLIDQTLQANGVVFDDIRLELLDHIAADIEKECDCNGLCFDQHFKSVFEKWKPQLRPESGSWWLGNFQAPAFVYSQWVDYSKKQGLLSLVFSVVMALIITGFIVRFPSEKTLTFLADSFRILFTAIVLLVFAARLWIWHTKVKTSYSHLFKKRSLFVFLQPMIYTVGLIPVKFYNFDFQENLIMAFFYAALLLYGAFDLRLVVRHYETVKKLKFS